MIRNFCQWRCRDRILECGKRPYIMGILNVTPDSFSDGGLYDCREKALQHAKKMHAAGADIIDVGGESTRPEAEPVTEQEELRRVIPLIRDLAQLNNNMLLSVDTMKAPVAQAAIDAGAHIINDVSALTADKEMIKVARAAQAGVILMHMQGSPATMQDNPAYNDVVREVREYLEQRLAVASDAGLQPECCAIDPGIGFGKNNEHNLILLKNLDKLIALNRPLVLGLSRKRIIGHITGREICDRLAGSLAALTLCVTQGVHIVRVHDVAETADAIRVAEALTGEE